LEGGVLGFRDELKKFGYSWSNTDRTFKRPRFIGIGYSDGTETEASVYQAVVGAEDVTILSSEMLDANDSWPLRYHLNPTRANLMRPLKRHIQGRVLEIGAGCGAITRFLGEETDAQILALEGSPVRARIAAERTRDLENVTVMVEDIWKFPSKMTFDVITLIGVLEYSPVFTDKTDPFREMLTHVRKLLKPSGVLIVAIENKLGLKYLAGSNEDHHGKPMVGVEGRYGRGEATTFGHKEIVTLLGSTGFPQVETYVPLPDYKLVRSVVSEAGMAHPTFNPTDLFSAATRADNNFARSPSFDVGLAFRQFHKNGMGTDISNSFLLVASKEHERESKTLAWHYSVERAAEFAKQTTFEAGPRKSVIVKSERLADDVPAVGPVVNGLVTQTLEKYAPYFSGTNLAGDIYRVMAPEGWHVSELAAAMNTYVDAIVSVVQKETKSRPPRHIETHIPGSFIDAIPQNFLRASDGKITLIDREWNFASSISFGFLIFRAFITTISAAPRVGGVAGEPLLTREELCERVFAALGFVTTPVNFVAWAEEEREWQSLVRGTEIATWSHHGDWLLVDNFSQALVEAKVAAKVSQAYENTRSWRATAPLRELANRIRAQRQP
jgi:SAM-dependent methyltransferase